MNPHLMRTQLYFGVVGRKRLEIWRIKVAGGLLCGQRRSWHGMIIYNAVATVILGRTRSLLCAIATNLLGAVLRLGAVLAPGWKLRGLAGDGRMV